ncbi:hypothetical protein NW762_012987 [Fusarium torreyae]|uniref:Uncharacterized protein n=1 Tax=Fusarium torreyae TaxID=1237075 RepID=A0A9W8V862_9HYPO|nr:hypothetical protein NW762_012987 [Fusarium torreyae]
MPKNSYNAKSGGSRRPEAVAENASKFRGKWLHWATEAQKQPSQSSLVEEEEAKIMPEAQAAVEVEATASGGFPDHDPSLTGDG